jgi:SPP1 gp7 family putative phage head morphogenesis protein
MNDVNSWLDRNPGISDPRSVALGVALETNEFNREQWRKIVRSVLSIDLFQSEPWLEPKVETFVVENVKLIKSIQDQSLDRIEQQVILAIQRGDRFERIQELIEKEYNRSENRARLIARDQVGKLNGDLSRFRQTDLGVTHYIWRTAMDERVRGNPLGPAVPPGQNHWDREGKRFAWNDPPPDGHPGFPIQCRCYAEPDMKQVFELSQPETP